MSYTFSERMANDDTSDATETEKKERVLHTRVPQSLDRHLKRRARSLGLSVSTVVRNVLLNTFGLVEDIVTDGANLAFTIAGDDEPAHPRPSSRQARATNGAAIVAWQPVILNLNAVCRECNALLPRGTRAAIGVGAEPGPQAIICEACLERVGQP